MKDLFGKAILDYQTNNSPENIITTTTISDADEMNVSYLFRCYEDMPALEQKALQLAKGHVLDVGCGAGSHSLFLQNELKLDVTSIDISPNAIKTCLLRGLEKAKIQDLWTMKDETFDTIILLMNGTGIFKTLKQTVDCLVVLKTLLKPNGQILIDSSDINYMFDECQKTQITTSKYEYYGELTFSILYKKQSEQFPWLYLDFDTLKRSAKTVGFQCDLVIEGEHHDYLARITNA